VGNFPVAAEVGSLLLLFFFSFSFRTIRESFCFDLWRANDFISFSKAKSGFEKWTEETGRQKKLPRQQNRNAKSRENLSALLFGSHI